MIQNIPKITKKKTKTQKNTSLVKTRILSEQMLKAEHETFQLVLLPRAVAWISTCALTKSSFYDSHATVMH